MPGSPEPTATMVERTSKTTARQEDRLPPRPQPRARLRRAAYAASLLLAFLAAAEIVARIEGALKSGESLLVEPDVDADLKLRDSHGVRGRPGGSYMNCRLNEFGFRGPSITLLPPPGVLRVMVLGSSESFGSTEATDAEFPARLNEALHERGRIEVVNASIIGMTPRSMLPYWRNWACQFQPHVVVVYPNAFFYLNAVPAREGPTTTAAAPRDDRPHPLGSRLLFRLHRTLHFPDWIQAWRDNRTLAQTDSGRPPGWLFTGVPDDRLAAFREDMDELVALIRQQGAQPFLVTHPISASTLDNSADAFQLRHMRTICPRAREDLFLSFSVAANQVVADVAKDKGIPVIDLARDMTGRREMFADLVHFNGLGASKAAELMADALGSRLSDRIGKAPPGRNR